MRIILYLILLFISACSADSQIVESHPSVSPIASQDPSNPDLHNAEEVTTSNGSIVKGTFGEISEKKVLSSGAVIEGAFYE